MESAGSFTAVPGKGGIAMGCIALAASALAAVQARPENWLAVWLSAAALALIVGVTAAPLRKPVLKYFRVLRGSSFSLCCLLASPARFSLCYSFGTGCSLRSRRSGSCFTGPPSSPAVHSPSKSSQLWGFAFSPWEVRPSLPRRYGETGCWRPVSARSRSRSDF